MTAIAAPVRNPSPRRLSAGVGRSNVGVAVVAMSALPVVGNETSLARNYLNDPMVGVAEAFHPRWYSDPLKYVIAAPTSG